MYKMNDKKQWTAKIVTLIITTLCISGCLIYAVFACKGEDLTKVFAAESFSLLVNGIVIVFHSSLKFTTFISIDHEKMEKSKDMLREGRSMLFYFHKMACIIIFCTTFARDLVKLHNKSSI